MPENQKKIRTYVAEYLQTLNPDAVVWKTVSQSFTSAEMVGLLQRNEETALVWLTEMFRAVRHLIAREANKDVQEVSSVVDTSNVCMEPFKHLLNECNGDEIMFRNENFTYTAAQISMDNMVFNAWSTRVLTKTLSLLPQ